jgi:hypothetical protein
MKLKAEVLNNFLTFATDLRDSFSKNYDVLDVKKDIFLGSYERLSSLQAWRAFILEKEVSKNSLDFFIEAQNDALLSHCFARIGSWRGALKSLRSSIDNILFFYYYKDHPIEYRLWEIGKHQLPISEYVSYLYHHPDFIKLPDKITGVETLKAEYSTLSKAVHGSSKLFRMTHNGTFPTLMAPELPLLNQWVTREKECVRFINLTLITAFKDHLQGAKMRDLRKSISFAVPQSLHTEINTKMGVRLF